MFNVQGAIRCHKIETQITVEDGFGRRDILKCIGATIGMVRTIPFFYLSLYLMHELYVALVFLFLASIANWRKHLLLIFGQRLTKKTLLPNSNRDCSVG